MTVIVQNFCTVDGSILQQNWIHRASIERLCDKTNADRVPSKQCRRGMCLGAVVQIGCVYVENALSRVLVQQRIK